MDGRRPRLISTRSDRTQRLTIMAVRMRLKRMGHRNRPHYRICVIEGSKPRDGAYIESLGFYDPFIRDDSKKVRIKKDRAEYWLSVGAQPSETVLSFLKREKVDGLIHPKPKRKRRKKTAKKVPAGTKSRKPPKKEKAKS